MRALAELFFLGLLLAFSNQGNNNFIKKSKHCDIACGRLPLRMLTNRRVYADRQEFVHRESGLVFLWFERMVQSRSFTAPHILCIHTLLLHKETKISLSTRQIDKQTDWLQTCTFSRDFFPHLRVLLFKIAWGYSTAPQIPKAHCLAPNSHSPSVSHEQLMR